MVDVGDDLKVFDSHHLRLQIAVVIVQVLPRLTDLHLILFYCFCCFHLSKVCTATLALFVASN